MTDVAAPRRAASDPAWASVVHLQSLSLTGLVVWSLLDRAPGVPGTHGRPLVAGCCLALIVLGWGVWAGSRWRRRLLPAALVILVAGGGVLAVVSGQGPGSAVGAVAVVIAAGRLRTEVSLAVLAAGVLGVAVSAVAVDASVAVWLSAVATFCGGWVLGGVRRSYRLRAEEAERALAEERRAVAAEKHAAALEERARIAREIHDILAHSLSALSVHLGAAERLLTGPTEADLEKARQTVRLAGGLAREGMAETRRAVLALREDERPSHEMVAELVQTHGDGISLEIAGSPADPSPQAGLVVLRTAQEALTNVRKHAPGAAVTIRLAYEPDAVDLTVVSTLPAAGAERPLADQGTGRGLTGLAERAGLAGGTLEAGPRDGVWRVHLRIPG